MSAVTHDGAATEPVVVKSGTYGGVNAITRTGSLAGAGTGDLPVRTPVGSAAFSGFTYHGGPVIGCAQVYPTFWGDQWLTDPASTQRAGRLSQFVKDFLASGYMNILSQYGCGSGAGSAGVFVRSGFVSGVPNNLDETSIHSTLQACINNGAIPEPVNSGNKWSTPVAIIFLADTIAVNSANLGAVMCEANGDTAFGYHWYFTTTGGHALPYAVIPGLTNACLQQSCPGNDAGCSLHLAETQEQRQTQVTSHEFSEMVSDPELTAWYDPSHGENGDICNGVTGTITVGPNTWNVQRMYSHYDDIQTNGASVCALNPASAIPELSGGPTSGLLTAAQLKLQAPGTFDRLLPLPSFHHDMKTQTTEIKKADMKAYISNMVQPLQHENVFGDLASFLTQAAAAVK
jgi:hypothetical protein